MAQPTAGTSHKRLRPREVRTPFWKRLTSLFGLSSIVVLGGVLLAAILGLMVVVMLFALERAIAG